MSSAEEYPRIYKIKNSFKDDSIPDVDSAVEAAFERMDEISRGSSVAVSVGSRGIANIDRIVKKAISILKARDLKPFIVPAMGSHAGATQEGQAEMLEKLGVTEKDVGAPVRSSMAAHKIGTTRSGINVYFDREALKADAIVLINRIKPHTSFEGPYGSGLVKMLAVGLGNLEAARELHSRGTMVFKEELAEIAGIVIGNAPVSFGLAIVENALKKPKIISGLKPAEFVEEEPKLIRIARDSMPKLPFAEIDVLVVDFIGKDISGTGMDPYVIGRRGIWGEPDPTPPIIQKIVALDITEASDGNATGIGLADAITSRLAGKIDWDKTRENVLTTTFLEKGKKPLDFPSDREAILAGIRAAWVSLKNARLVRIRNTLDMEEYWVTEALQGEIKDREIVQKDILSFTNSGEAWRF